jgi:hypothetical protein
LNSGSCLLLFPFIISGFGSVVSPPLSTIIIA